MTVMRSLLLSVAVTTVDCVDRSSVVVVATKKFLESLWDTQVGVTVSLLICFFKSIKYSPFIFRPSSQETYAPAHTVVN